MFNRNATSHLPWSSGPLVMYTEQPAGVNGPSRPRVLHQDEQAARFAGAFSIRSILSHAARSQTEMSGAHPTQENRYLSSRVPTACSFVNQTQVACYNEEHLQQPPLNQKSHLMQSPIQSHEASITAFGTTKLQGCSLGSQDNKPRHARRGSKRSRTIFTPFQLSRLEKAFERQQYVAGEERRQLATGLNLTETQVKVWFQNRRIRFRKQRIKIATVV